MTYDFSNLPTPVQYSGSATPYDYTRLDRSVVGDNARFMFEEWFRNHIKINGVPVQYARVDADFAKTITDSGGNIDWAKIDFDPIYMEKPAMEYYQWEPIVVIYMNNSDAFLLDKFNFGRKSNGQIFVLKRDFYEMFRYKFGSDITESATLSIQLSTVNQPSATGSKETIPWAFTWQCSTLPFTAGTIKDTFAIESTTRAYNPSAGWSRSYPAVDDLQLSATACQISGLTATLSFDITYKGRWYPAPTDPNVWPLAPNVKDFFVMRVGDRYERFSISYVTDQDFQQAGMNTLLYDYMWRCDVVRMTNSFETGTDLTLPNVERDLQKLIDETAEKVINNIDGGEQNSFYGGNGAPDDWNRQVLGI